jgi:hypothetical protein
MEHGSRGGPHRPWCHHRLTRIAWADEPIPSSRRWLMYTFTFVPYRSCTAIYSPRTWFSRLSTDTLAFMRCLERQQATGYSRQPGESCEANSTLSNGSDRRSAYVDLPAFPSGCGTHYSESLTKVNIYVDRSLSACRGLYPIVRIPRLCVLYSSAPASAAPSRSPSAAH